MIKEKIYEVVMRVIVVLLSLFLLNASAMNKKVSYACTKEKCIIIMPDEEAKFLKDGYNIWQIISYNKTFVEEGYFEARIISWPLVDYIHTDDYYKYRAELTLSCLKENDGSKLMVSLSDPEIIADNYHIESDAYSMSQELTDEYDGAEIIALQYKIDERPVDILYSLTWLSNETATFILEEDSRVLLRGLFGSQWLTFGYTDGIFPNEINGRAELNYKEARFLMTGIDKIVSDMEEQCGLKIIILKE